MKYWGIWICCFTVLGAALAEAPVPIFNRSKAVLGMTIRNRYAYVAVMNASLNDGRFGARDFRVLPQTRPDGRETLDPYESMFRYMLRPEVLVTVPGRRGPRTVESEKGWSMEALPDGSVGMRLASGEDGSLLVTELKFSLSPEMSVLDGVCKLTNRMDRECTVHFKPVFYALIPELKPMRLILPHRINLFTIAGNETYWRNEETLLNNDASHYWWRTENNGRISSEKALNTESIRFDDTRVLAPSNFGVGGLSGGNLVVWEWGETEKPAALEFRWLRDMGCAAPVWTRTFAPGQTSEIHFRLLMVRGAPRYDNIGKNWIFAYLPLGNMLRVLSLPLNHEERVSLNVSLTDPRGTNLINNRREMAGATPLTPGRMNYRLAAPFVSGERYRIQLQMDSLKDSTRLLEVFGTVQP